MDHDHALASFAEAVAAATDGRVSASDVREHLGPDSSMSRLATGDVIIEQHAVATDFKVLVEGGVTYRHVVSDDRHETIQITDVPWVPIGWSGLNLRRHRVTATAAGNGLLLSLPVAAFDRLNRDAPAVWAALIEFALRAAARTLWLTRGVSIPAADGDPTSVDELRRGEMAVSELKEMYDQSAALGGLPADCRGWLSERTELYVAEPERLVLHEGSRGDGLWLLFNGRVRMAFRMVDEGDADGVRMVGAARTAVRSGTLLTAGGPAGGLPVPFDVTTTRVTRLAHLPLDALRELVDEYPAWAGNLLGQQLWQLRNWLTWTRSRIGTDFGADGVGAVEHLVEDSSPVLPVNSPLYGVPYLLRNPLTREDGFRRLHGAQLHGRSAERAAATTALDLVRDLERGHRFRVGMQSTYDAVVASEHLPPVERRRISTRHFRDALQHVPYVIDGIEHLPDDPNFILIYNHMAYAEDSVLPNGFLFNPDSHFISGVVLEPHYGDGIRVARTNAATEFWRADYYERLGHIPVATPESGWIEETPAEKAARKQKFFEDCSEVLASGLPFSIAPEGTITEEDSVTERSPGPLKAGAFLMSQRLPSRPSILPVALANFDRPAHAAVFSCVIKPAFRMQDRGVDVEDRGAMAAFLEGYRRELRGHVEEAIALAEEVMRPDADLEGLVTNLGHVDTVHEEFEPDVRALELRPRASGPDAGATVFYGSSTLRLWTSVGDDVGVPRAVNLGFGGSTLEACEVYFERVVLPHAPDCLVLYAGDNDIGRGVPAERVVDLFRCFAANVRTHRPTTRCWFVSIKPSPGREEFADTIRAANAGIASLVEGDDRWRYVDWYRHLVGADGRANPRLFQPDGLHVNGAAYAILAGLLRDELHDD